jgi:hypothetical protein
MLTALACVMLTGAATATPRDVGWCTTGGGYQPQDGPITCLCGEYSSRAGGVWGDGIYSDDSALCAAAVHAGVIGDAGGRITFVPTGPQSRFGGASRNGVTSNSNGAWRGSYRFPGAGPASAPMARQAPQRTTISDGPASINANAAGVSDAQTAISTPTRAIVPEFRGDCPVDAMQTRKAPLQACRCAPNRGVFQVWGDGIYTDDSSLCTAARHAGRITAAGGIVFYENLPGQSSYQGATRHGITSSAYGSYAGSFRFVNVPPAQQRAMVAPPATTKVGDGRTVADVSGNTQCLVETPLSRQSETVYTQSNESMFDWRNRSVSSSGLARYRLANRCRHAVTVRYGKPKKEVRLGPNAQQNWTCEWGGFFGDRCYLDK